MTTNTKPNGAQQWRIAIRGRNDNDKVRTSANYQGHWERAVENPEPFPVQGSRSTLVATVASELGAGTTGHVCVSSNGTEMGWASSKVVVGDSVGKTGIGTMAVSTVRVEGRVGHATVVGSIICLLPVDRLHPLVKPLGASELPLAEDGPNDKDTTNGGDGGNEDGSDVALGLVGLCGSCHGRWSSGFVGVD